MSGEQYHHISSINLTLRFPIHIHVPLHLSYSIIDNLYNTGASLIMTMTLLLVLALILCILCTSVFTSITDFVFISNMFRASHLSF